MSKIELHPVMISDEYAKKWNERSTDFVYIWLNNIPVSDTLYRKGGLFSLKNLNDKYIKILKYVEDMYEDNITKDPSKKPHLAGIWCAIDTETGKEVYVETERSLNSFYIVAGCIASHGDKVFNLLSGEVYSDKTSKYFRTKDFIFIQDGNRYNGSTNVIQIDHRTGIVINTFEK